MPPHVASCTQAAQPGAINSAGHVTGSARPLSLSFAIEERSNCGGRKPKLASTSKSASSKMATRTRFENSFWNSRSPVKPGYKTPLVADIHFTPKVALVCADFVDKVRHCRRCKHGSLAIVNHKVRVNPGNFADGCSRSVESHE